MDDKLNIKQSQFVHSNVEGYWDKIYFPYPENDLFPSDEIYPEDIEEGE